MEQCLGLKKVNMVGFFVAICTNALIIQTKSSRLKL